MIHYLLDGILIEPAGKMILWRNFFRIVLVVWIIMHLIYYHKPIFSFLKPDNKKGTMYWIEVILSVLVVVGVIFFAWEYFRMGIYFDKAYFEMNPVRII